MKREFLQSIKIGEAGLPKEAIDAIMEENGRDINAAKAAAVKPFVDYDDILAENTLLKQGQAMADGKTAAQWKALYGETMKNHETQLDLVRFQNLLDSAIAKAGGRNAKAITALLNLPELQAAENRQTALWDALKDLQRSDGYLFETQTPPPYARGTGTRNSGTDNAPQTLAGALREKFERK